jgi:hypothetical protein
MEPGSTVHELSDKPFIILLKSVKSKTLYNFYNNAIINKELFDTVDYICFDNEKECYYNQFNDVNINLLILFELFNGTYIKNYFIKGVFIGDFL